jgi:hypothetical protein
MKGMGTGICENGMKEIRVQMVVRDRDERARD